MCRFSARWNVASEDSPVRRDIVDFAFLKLTSYQSTDLLHALKEGQGPKVSELLLSTKLTSLGVRILLHFNLMRQAARAMEEDMVTRNLRIVFSIPEHREYMCSGSPSEPLLAEAAARCRGRRSSHEHVH